MKLRSLIVALSLFFALDQAFADASDNFLVLGVIASTKDKAGIALLKNSTSGRTFAVKQSSKIDPKSTLLKVTRKHIVVEIEGQVYKIEVGGDIATAVVMQKRPYSPSSENYVENAAQEVQKDGNTIKVSNTYKDHLVNGSLEKILMQAAAVPHVENGKLRGFELWEIEKDSVFEVAGFKDGDLITKINDQEITDIGMTIRMLNSLKNAPSAKFDFMRNGAKQDLTILVQ